MLFYVVENYTFHYSPELIDQGYSKIDDVYINKVHSFINTRSLGCLINCKQIIEMMKRKFTFSSILYIEYVNFMYLILFNIHLDKVSTMFTINSFTEFFLKIHYKVMYFTQPGFDPLKRSSFIKF